MHAVSLCNPWAFSRVWSEEFLSECDRLGLLVFTEIPGWQHIGGNPGVLPKAKVPPDPKKAMLVSECSGHMFPTRPFDNWSSRQEQTLRHARVQNDAKHIRVSKQDVLVARYTIDGEEKVVVI